MSCAARHPAVLVVAPATQPISDGLAKDHLRIDDDAWAQLMAAHLSSAVTEFERLTGRALVASTWDYTIDAWPWSGRIELPKGVVSQVLSVGYVDRDGVAGTFDDWDLDVTTASVVLKAGATWPSVPMRSWSPITVRFVAGWPDEESVPADIKTAILFKLQCGMDGGHSSNVGTYELEKARLEQIFQRTVMRYKTFR